MVGIEKDHAFDGPKGGVTLADLFEGNSQLIVQHVMYGPDWEAACPGCTAWIPAPWLGPPRSGHFVALTSA